MEANRSVSLVSDIFRANSKIVEHRFERTLQIEEIHFGRLDIPLLRLCVPTATNQEPDAPAALRQRLLMCMEQVPYFKQGQVRSLAVMVVHRDIQRLWEQAGTKDARSSLIGMASLTAVPSDDRDVNISACSGWMKE